jgi:hypothetical protein
MNHKFLQRLAIFIVVFHLIISLVHGTAHSQLHIDMNLWQSLYILIVITLLPIISGFLVWRRWRGGFFLLTVSMLGSLMFGGYYHFVAAGADNIASLGSHSWTLPFQLTAVLIAITEAAGVLTGLLGMLKQENHA